MSRYAWQERDQKRVAEGFTVENREGFHRANRRLWLASILDDVDLVVGHQAVPEMYAAAMLLLGMESIADSIQDVELSL